MTATIDLPDGVLQHLEKLAVEEGTTAAGLIRRLVMEHVARHSPPSRRTHEVRLPLIPASQTGLIGPFSGEELDELFAREDFAS